MIGLLNPISPVTILSHVEQKSSMEKIRVPKMEGFLNLIFGYFGCLFSLT